MAITTPAIMRRTVPALPAAGAGGEVAARGEADDGELLRHLGGAALFALHGIGAAPHHQDLEAGRAGLAFVFIDGH